MRLLLAPFFCLSLLAQAPKPPQFDPNNPDGLVVSPNPKVRYAFKRKVFWKVGVGGTPTPLGKIPPYTAAERQQASAQLDALAAIFKATPMGGSGEGYWVNDSRTFGYGEIYDLPGNAAFPRFPLNYSAAYFPFYHEDVMGNNGQWRLSVNGETESIQYRFNRHPEAVGQQVIAAESRGRELREVQFYLRPRVTGRIGGLPVYEGDVLVVARAGRELWAPAPLGRVLKAALPKYEQDRKSAEDRLAGYKKGNDEVQSAAWEQDFRERFEKANGALRTTRPSNYETRRNSMEREIRYTREKAAAEASPARDEKGAWYWNPVDAHQDAERRLAALTPAQAAQPACFAAAASSPKKDGRYQMSGDILAAGASPDCREIVMTNWDYFDVTLPRATPQLLTIVSFGRCAKLEGERIVSASWAGFSAPPHGCFRHAQMWRELDWSRFAALVRP